MIKLVSYLEKNGRRIAISAIPLLVYALVIGGLMIKGYIPIYSWDINMPFSKKMAWEMAVNSPAIAWIVSWVIIATTEK